MHIIFKRIFMREVFVRDFLVSGLKVRTSNVDEFNMKTAKIPALWEKFCSHEVFDTIQNRSENFKTYGVYTNYTSDVDGEYDILVGVGVESENPSLDNIKIKGGKFLVFEKSGQTPQIVIELWQEVWEYFKTSKTQRAYTNDFEKYISEDRVELYIAIK